MTTMCRVLGVQRTGFYAWLAAPLSDRAKEDRRLTGLVKQAWLESGTVYGYRKVTGDLRDLGETCGKHRIYRLMQAEGADLSRVDVRRDELLGAAAVRAIVGSVE